jgi:syntaxin 5
MFVNNDSEIHGLQKMVKDTIPVHFHSIQQLEDIYKEGSYTESEQHQRHTKTVVGMLKMKLAEVSKQFKVVSDARELKQGRNRERRGLLTGSAGGRANNQGALAFEDMPSVFSGLQGPTDYQEDTVVDMPAEAVQTLALLQNDTQLAQREEAMSELESTVTEVQSIFIEMAKLIAMQGESVERIDDNIDSAERSVERGHGELVKALTAATSNKWLMMKIFGILLGFFILFVVVFA